MKPIYSAIFLTKESKEKLLKAFPAKHSNVYAEHLTLKFGLSKDDINFTPLGKEVKLHVFGYAEDEKGQAVLVDCPIQSNNENPHITISCAEGTKPFYSNELIKKGFKTVEIIELEGIVDFYPRTI